MKRASCLLLLGACTAANAPETGGVSGLQGGRIQPAPEPTTYVDWLDTLPMVEGEASKPFQADFHGKITVQVPMEGVSVDVQMNGRIEYADLRHFRERIDLRVDLGGIEEGLPEEPVNFTILVSADGEKLYIEPMLEEGWLLDTLREAPVRGLEAMTFTLDLDLFEQMFQVYWDFLEESDVEMSTILPDGVSVEEFFKQGLNPAAWARLYLMTADIETFRVDSTEVHVTARLRDGWAESLLMAEDPQAAAMMDEFLYEMCFDRRTGIPTSLGMSMGVDDVMSFDMVIDFKQFLIGDNIFAPNHFDKRRSMGRTEFPIDTFIEMALLSMQGQMIEEDEDIPF